MNSIISDTAEYGCYLFDHACKPLLADFIAKIDLNVIGKKYDDGLTNSVDNQTLVAVNAAIRNHPVEEIGVYLRAEMADMKSIAVG